MGMATLKIPMIVCLKGCKIINGIASPPLHLTQIGLSLVEICPAPEVLEQLVGQLVMRHCRKISLQVRRLDLEDEEDEFFGK